MSIANKQIYLKVYCDGACSGNPGPGGWAFVIPSLDVEVSGYCEDTTNNRMEITAVVQSLEYIKKYYNDIDPIEIVTDSQYVINTMTKGWKKNKNTDLWSTLDSLLVEFQHRVIWTWVKGHADNKYNQRCDELAVKEYTTYKEHKKQEKVDEQRRELVCNDEKDSILEAENIALFFRPYEKHVISKDEYVIIYQSMYLDNIFVAEVNNKELLVVGTYEDCKRALQHFKFSVEQKHKDLPF